MEAIDLKSTLNLPRTDFPMKANLGQLESKLLARWDESGIYQQIRSARKGRPTYVLHDGPPYANGNIHLGHAFNKILKDFIVKIRTMEGYDSPYVPGWDCHGLPIEIKVDSQLGSKKASMAPEEIRAACRKYAEKYVDLQRKDFMRLGVFGRWNDPYLTMSAQYEAVIAGAFVDFLDQGYVYKGLKPVNWCIHDRTALAEAEVEYENHTSPSIWVKFALTSDPASIDPALAGKKVWGLIWTTTPWTIPANLAICYHPRFSYAAADVEDEIYIVAVDLLRATAEACGWGEPKVIAAFEGSRLDGTLFKHPFLDRTSVGILGDHVTLEQGTGAVHTAPGHGQEDYQVGLANHLSVYCPVDGAGRFYHAEGASGRLPEGLIGKTIWQGNPIVIDLLTKAGALAATRKIEHSYPHCWRCHNPTIFRATEQWFISMEHNNLRQRALEAIQNVKWNPAWGQERIGNMIATRPDWCISRQRAWGVPILVFYCEACHEPFTDRRVLDRVVALIREHTADVWYSRSAAELMGEDGVCKKCGGTAFRKEHDILDVWFDSGASHLAVLTPENHLPWPADMYLEGGDQYRGWFHSSLLVAVGLRGSAPYRATATNGWTLDGEGRALSKSKGAEEVEKVINKYGAELLRLWTASVDFTEDVRFSDTIVSRLIEAYRKLRNTFRYALGNLDDFDPLSDAVPAEGMLEIDRWILARASELIADCRALVRRTRISQGLSRHLRFRHDRLERGLFRRPERSPLHGRHQEPCAAQRTNGAVQDPLRADAAGGAAARVYHGRSVEPYEEAGRRAGECPSGDAAGARGARLGPQRHEARNVGAAFEHARSCFESAGRGASGEADRHVARSAGSAAFADHRVRTAQGVRAGPSIVVHRFPSGAGTAQRRGRRRIGSRGRTRRWREMRTMLEIFDQNRSRRRIPDCLRLLRGGAPRNAWIREIRA